MAKKTISQINDVDIRLLRIFKTVVEFGGITPAENVLNISCSTITRYIKDLEIKLGFVLCHRGRSGFVLSKEGEQVYDALNLLLNSINEFRTKLNQIHQKLTGELKIAVFDTISHMNDIAITKTIEKVQEIAPDIVISLDISSTTNTEKGLSEGRFDLGIIQYFQRSNAFHYYPICDMQLALYCGNKHPLFSYDESSYTANEIIKYPIASTSYYSNKKEQGHSLGLNQKAIANDEEAMAMFILSGQYLGFLPEPYANKFFTNTGLMKKVNLKGVNYTTVCGAITLKNTKPSVLTHLFIETLLAESKKAQ
jgi:LysR family transcriptional regulator, transcriptional activator for bauABCD operon